MIPDALRWLGHNLGTLLLAFILAVVVWVSATLTEDPNEERVYARPIPLERTGQDTSLSITNEIPGQVRVTLMAPQSVWTRLNNNPGLIDASIDLTGLGAGKHEVTVDVEISRSASPVRVVSIDPDIVDVDLEPLVSQEFPVQLTLDGEPSLGYRRGEAEINPGVVTVTGPESLVSKVARVQASIDIAGARDSKKITQTVFAYNGDGELINGLAISPKMVSIDIPITLEGGYKNVVVKVVTMGQIASGYRLTNIAVTPLNVTLFSTNPRLINNLPGFVETLPVNLAGLNDDVEIRQELALPADVSLVGEDSVLVQISVAAIESSLKFSIPIDKIGLPPELSATISPATVDVIVSGPLPLLDGLTTASFRAIVDLTGLAPDTYQLSPVIDLYPEDIRVESIQPKTVEVVVFPTPPAAPTGQPEPASLFEGISTPEAATPVP